MPEMRSIYRMTRKGIRRGIVSPELSSLWTTTIVGDTSQVPGDSSAPRETIRNFSGTDPRTHRCQMVSRKIVIWIHRIDFFFFFFFNVRSKWIPRSLRASSCSLFSRNNTSLSCSDACIRNVYPGSVYPGTHQTSMCSIFVNVFFSLSRCIRPVRLFH